MAYEPLFSYAPDVHVEPIPAERADGWLNFKVFGRRISLCYWCALRLSQKGGCYEVLHDKDMSQLECRYLYKRSRQMVIMDENSAKPDAFTVYKTRTKEAEVKMKQAVDKISRIAKVVFLGDFIVVTFAKVPTDRRDEVVGMLADIMTDTFKTDFVLFKIQEMDLIFRRSGMPYA